MAHVSSRFPGARLRRTNHWELRVGSRELTGEFFACLTLEGAQAGLSSSTILRKRWKYRLVNDHLRACFRYRQLAGRGR